MRVFTASSRRNSLVQQPGTQSNGSRTRSNIKPRDLAPGEKIPIELPAIDEPFDMWVAHPEVGPSSGGSGEGGGEHGGEGGV